jgi:hypothetical protein
MEILQILVTTGFVLIGSAASCFYCYSRRTAGMKHSRSESDLSSISIGENSMFNEQNAA